MAGLTARIRCEKPFLDVNLAADSGQTIALLGANGAGKSTALAVLAGVRRGPGSRIDLDDVVLDDHDRHVPPHRRSVVLLTQQARLFPHLSVRRNVAYGPRSAGLARAEIAARTEYWLELTGARALAELMPGTLSGGQAHRVALARALAAQPRVLLLDEPFASLDIEAAQQIRSLLRELIAQRDGITVLVTHDPIDAVGLAAEMIVLDSGRVAQRGTPREILSTPAHPFSAALSGLNVVFGRRDGATVVVGDQRIVGRSVDDSIDEMAAAAFAPRAVSVYRELPHGSPRTTLAAVITDLIPRGDHAVIRTACAEQTVAAEVTWDAIVDLGLAVGQQVWLSVKAGDVRIYGVSAAS